MCGCELTELCRAALWYCKDVAISHSCLHGIKALRECSDVTISDSSILSAEFGWFSRSVHMEFCSVQGEYFMLRSASLAMRNVKLVGKYAFQYVEGGIFDSCDFETKDAFWHAKNVTVRNSTIKSEYLAWYSDGLTLENCRIIGTQPLCYCKNLRLIDCEMLEADLSFERSDVEANLLAPVVSIKNPLSGVIVVPAVGKIIRDIDEAKGAVVFSGAEDKGNDSKE